MRVAFRQVLGMKEVGFVGDALSKAERALKASEIGLSNGDGSGIGIGKEVQKATQVNRRWNMPERSIHLAQHV